MSAPSPLRVAVVGAGAMGQHHLRIYNGLKGVELVAVVDTDRARAVDVADQYGCAPLSDTRGLEGRVDACSIAVPSTIHSGVARQLISYGIHCLIEKPLALTEEDCENIISAASAAGVEVLVGHVERFNPAVQQLLSMTSPSTVRAVEVRRMSSASARVTDVDVVADLMVHDLDIIRAVLGTPTTIRASAVRHSSDPDYVTAALEFSSGAVATLIASRITQSKIRELHVTSDTRLFTVDYSTQELCIFQQGRVIEVDQRERPSEYALDVAMERVFVRNAEPLRGELEHFVRVANGAEPPLVSARDALETMRLVWAVQAAVNS